MSDFLNNTEEEVKYRERKTDSQVEIQLEDIRRRISSGQSYSKIIAELKIPKGTFFYYKKKLEEESADRLRNKTSADLALDMDILRDMLMDMYRIAIDNCKHSPELVDIPSNLEIAQQLAINLFKLQTEGYQAVKYQQLEEARRKLGTRQNHKGLTTEEQE